MQPWSLSGSEVLSLSVEELGLRILQDCDANHGRDGLFNFDSWRDAAIAAYRSDHRAQRKIVEAWNWVHLKGLVAQDPSQSSRAFVFITTSGERVLDEGLHRLKVIERLDVPVHTLLGPAKELFLAGRFDTAAFEAMKAVEVRAREIGRYPNDLLGVGLMRTAFGETGVLGDPGVTGGERVAVMELFAGAIGAFKNPGSHRYVDYDDPTEASEVILLANLLMRLLDRVETRLSEE